MTVTSDFIPVTSPLLPHVSSSYHHCALLIMFLIVLVLAQCKTGSSCTLLYIMPLSFLLSIPQTALLFHHPNSLHFQHHFPFFSILFSFICSLLYSCHVSILSIYPNPLLLLFPFTLFASDSVRQPLSAWLKSSGPAGGAKPWACFPSERLLFAHSGN